MVNENSRELALQYLDMRLGDDYPETRLVFCGGCQAVNGNAWDAIMSRFGGRNKPQLVAQAAWECEYHPDIKFWQRIDIARRLESEMLYREYPLEVSGEVMAKNIPVLAICTQNGGKVNVVDLGWQDRVLEDKDRLPDRDSLADYALRCQQTFEFFETFGAAMVEASVNTK